MSDLELFIDEIDGRLHAVVTYRTMLYDLYVDPLDMTACWGSLYFGKVKKIDTNLDAAFVDIGGGLMGYLPAKHAGFKPKGDFDTDSHIQELVKPGEMVLVQIKAEAKNASMHEEQKLPRLTRKIYFPGQYLVYSPFHRPVLPMRTAKNAGLIELLSGIKIEGGWSAPKYAEKAGKSDIQKDAERLYKEWQALQAKVSADKNTPRIVQPGKNALQRVLMDYGVDAFEHIYVASKKIFDMMGEWCAKYNPSFATSKRLQLFRPEKPGQRLFDIHDIYGGLEDLHETCLPLNSGGSLIIEPTHAVIVMDVNQGSCSSSFTANQEAAFEAARQVRLRNLSGAILIDFINMSQKLERSRLVDTVTRAFMEDVTNAQVHGFTRLGIIEVTRKRRSGMLSEKLRK